MLEQTEQQGNNVAEPQPAPWKKICPAGQEQIWAEVQAAQKRARARLLDRGDVSLYCLTYNQLTRIATALNLDPKNVKMRIDGGSVCNSYDYPAETTVLWGISPHVYACRQRARKSTRGSPGGFSCDLLPWTLTPDQAQLVGLVLGAGFVFTKNGTLRKTPVNLKKILLFGDPLWIGRIIRLAHGLR